MEDEETSGDSSNRGAVVGGKQMDGLIDLLRRTALDAGIPDESIITDKNYLPGYFRSSKDWDMLIISPSRKLIAAIELKSQVGSYGNNFNNRTEEAIGSAVDLWTAFREGQFREQQAPWVGWLMVVGRETRLRNDLSAIMSLISPSGLNLMMLATSTVTAFFARNSYLSAIIRLQH